MKTHRVQAHITLERPTVLSIFNPLSLNTLFYGMVGSLRDISSPSSLLLLNIYDILPLLPSADGQFKGWYDGFIAGRKFAVDMAGFAVNVGFLRTVSDEQAMGG